MSLKKNDFIEIEFTATTKDDGEIFDSNKKEDLEKTGSTIPPKPFKFPLGNKFFLKGVEDNLIGKDIGKHKIELSAENAFGLRDSKLIRMIPMKFFKQQNTIPQQGQMFNFDGRLGKVRSVSGGRVLVDFNNPVAGKDVIYDIEIKRKITNQEEKIKSLMDFLYRKEFPFELKDKKLIIKPEKPFGNFVSMFKEQFKEILDLDLEVEEQESKKEDKKETKN